MLRRASRVSDLGHRRYREPPDALADAAHRLDGGRLGERSAEQAHRRVEALRPSQQSADHLDRRRRDRFVCRLEPIDAAIVERAVVRKKTARITVFFKQKTDGLQEKSRR
jgi:hypothetical protein